jgi:UDP-glucose 4-epimerase
LSHGPFLVTGGAGFIGSHLVEKLSGECVVHVIDDLSRGRRAWLPGASILHEADIRDADSLAQLVEEIRPAAVAHLAALHFIPAVDSAPQLARELNVEGTANLLGALSAAPPQLLLFASSAAVYPDTTGPISESLEPDPIDVYGQTKLEGERLVQDFERATGTRCLVARIFNVIGRRETNSHVVPDLVSQLRSGAATIELGNLEARRDYTDVVDVASALVFMLTGPIGEHTTFNVGSGSAVSVRELVQKSETILGRSIHVEVRRDRLRTHDRSELVADIGRLRSTFGRFPTRLLDETLAELLDATSPDEF